jgi:hypothetical protein
VARVTHNQEVEYDEELPESIKAGIEYYEELPESVKAGIEDAAKLIGAPVLEGQDYLMQTDRVCDRCGSPAYRSNIEKYSYQCFGCDEDLYEFETSPAKQPPGQEASGGEEQRAVNDSRQERITHLFGNALDAIATLAGCCEYKHCNEMYSWLSEEVGMTDNEICEAGFEWLFDCVLDKNEAADKKKET